VSKDQIRTLENMHEGFARNFGAAMSGYMRTIVDCRLSVVDQLSYSEFVQSLPNPTCFNVLTAEPLEGKLVMEINPSIVFPIIDKSLGGGVTDSPVPDRPMTDIEMRLVGRVTNMAVELLANTWHPVREIHFALEGQPEPNPHLVSVAPPNVSCILITFELRMGDHSGLMNICIPYSVIEPVMAAFSAVQSWFAYGRKHQDPANKIYIQKAVQTAALPVIAYVGETSITLRELMDLKVGDVLTTAKGVEEALVVTVKGRPKFFARPGLFRGRKAVKVESQTEPEERV
jgi:flagellar motor switch protein FliM